MNVNSDNDSVIVTWLEPEEAGRAFDILHSRCYAKFGDVPIDVIGLIDDTQVLNWIRGTKQEGTTLTK